LETTGLTDLAFARFGGIDLSKEAFGFSSVGKEKWKVAALKLVFFERKTSKGTKAA